MGVDYLTLLPTGGGGFHPPSEILEFFKNLLISIPQKCLTLPKHILTWFRNPKNWHFLGGTTFRPLWKYWDFLKIGLKKYDIFLLQIRLVLVKWGCLQTKRIQNVKIWLSYELFFATRIFPQFLTRISKFLNFELLAVSFCMRPTIIYNFRLL